MLLATLDRPHRLRVVIDGVLDEHASTVRVHLASELEALGVHLEPTLDERMRHTIVRLDAVRVGFVEEHRRSRRGELHTQRREELAWA